MKKFIKYIIITTTICLFPFTLYAATPEIASTFESLGISWLPDSGGPDEQA